MVKENPFKKPDVEGAEGGHRTRALLYLRLEGPEQDLLLRLLSRGGKWSDLSCEKITRATMWLLDCRVVSGGKQGDW